MRRRLRGLETARREFIANASHELRTPIASLGGFIELLDDDPEPDPETRREFVRTMRGQIDRLTKLSTDLLDLSRLDADALSLQSQPVDLGEVAREVAAEFAAAAEQHGSEVLVGDRKPRGTACPSRSGEDRPDPAYSDRQRPQAHRSRNRDRHHLHRHPDLAIRPGHRHRRRPRDRHPFQGADLRALLHRRLGQRLRPRPGDRPGAGARDGRRRRARAAPRPRRLAEPDPAAGRRRLRRGDLGGSLEAPA